MKKSLVAAMALVAAAGAANAQVPSVEFRIIERDSQASIPNPVGATATTDAVLNFAVQARIVGGAGALGNFNFDIVAAGEPDTRGTLTKLLISNADGTYAANTANANNASVGRGGLAASYTYLAGINPAFNGSINASSGTFTNTAGNQEIGLVTGSPTGAALLLLTDLDGDGNPDTYPGTGTTAPLDSTWANTYAGANSNFVDIYRFKYTVSDVSTTRDITFNLANVGAQIATSLQLSNGVWGPVQANAGAASTGVTVHVVGIPAPASAALLGLGGLVATRRRRTA